LPLLGGIRDNLSDSLGVKRRSLCGRKRKSEEDDLGNSEHREGNVKVEARLKLEGERTVEHCTRRTSKRGRGGKEEKT
jgi:hypothetical protein